uniref:Uncharacterized protein n=1 Tax=Plectus sambesii TaxID=2011161 RepID=A0A914VCP0_9BILA
MRSVILAVLLLVASCSGAEYKCLNQTGRTFNARPDTLLPLNNYTVTIRTTDFVKSVSSETRETKLGNTVGIIKQTRADNSMQWIFRDNDYIFHDGLSFASSVPFFFVLALFMLVIGAAIGVGVAFFLWKRQRGGGGGLSYQVFE